MELSERVSELERKLEEMVVRGVISVSNPEQRWVIVSYGTQERPMTTGKLPIKPIRSGKAIVWWFPEVGEAVTVISPGDLRLGEVYPGSYYDQRPSPSDDPDLFLIEFGDGSKVSHHRGTHQLTIINEGDADVLIKGDVTAVVEGNLDATIKGDSSLRVEGHSKTHCEQSVSLVAKGPIDAKTEQSLMVKSAASMSLESGADMHLKAGGNMKLSASRIDFN